MEPMIRVEHLTKRYRKAAAAAVDDIGALIPVASSTVLFVRADRDR